MSRSAPRPRAGTRAGPRARAAAARLAAALTIAYWVALIVLTHLPAPRLPRVPVGDKTGHFVAFALLAGGMTLSISLAGRRDLAVAALAVALAYGAIDEWTQLLVGRSCELADWFADAAGAAVGVVGVSFLFAVAGSWRGRTGDRG